MVPVNPPPPERKIGRRTVARLLRIIDQFEALVRPPLIVGGKSITLFVRHMKCRVSHAERCENVLGEIRIEGLSGQDFDEATADIGRVGVHPALAGFVVQGNGAELVDEILEGHPIAPHTL